MPLHLTRQQRFQLRRVLRTTANSDVLRRTLALLQLDRGDTVAAVAVMLGVSRRTVHRWVGLYWDRPVPRSLIAHHSTGRYSEWDENARAILGATLQQPPDHFGYQATGWTVPLLQTHLAQWGLAHLSDATLRRQLHALGYVWKRPRYVLDPDPRRAAKMVNLRPTRYANVWAQGGASHSGFF
jgi:transposase